VWQLAALMLRSENAISPWPVAPCWPMKDSDSRLAVHGGTPVLVVVAGEVVVVWVVDVVAAVVVLAVLGDALEVFALRLLEPPQAVSATAAKASTRMAVIRM
jgi:hypothetical protein